MPRLSDEQRFQWTIDTFEEVFMTPWRYMVSGLFALAVFWSAAVALPVSAAAQEGQNSRGKKVEVHLTESFYRALGEQGAKTLYQFSIGRLSSPNRRVDAVHGGDEFAHHRAAGAHH
jgi:hypothetical protein